MKLTALQREAIELIGLAQRMGAAGLRLTAIPFTVRNALRIRGLIDIHPADCSLCLTPEGEEIFRSLFPAL